MPETTTRLSLPTVFALVAIVGAGAFALGQSTSTSSSPAIPSPPAAMPPAAAMPSTAIAESDEPLPPGHPPTGGAGAAGTGTGAGLPAGHPAVDSMDPAAAAQPSPIGSGAAEQPALEWKAPPRWQSIPNASTMRLATYRVPRAPGDSEDAELAITQAGGSVEANAVRWIGQFDAASQKTAKRSTRKVGSLEIAIVELQGNYADSMAASMGKEPRATSGRALLGAIVSTPGMPHFFKLTGPAKSVLAARAEFDAILASLIQR